MSADNFYTVVPNGDGYSAVMEFASYDGLLENGEPDPEYLKPRKGDIVFPSITKAVIWASKQYSEYGVSISPDCYEDED